MNETEYMNFESQAPETKKRNFFVALALKYKEYYRIHQQAGQTQRSSEYGNTTVINSAGESLEKKKRWGDPTEHCLVEAAAVEELAEMLHLNSEEKERLIAAAFVHDAGKKLEIESSRGVTDPEKIEQVSKKSEEQLRKGGIPEDVITLTKKVAHASLPHFAVLKEDKSIVLKSDADIVEMTMHYIDDVTRGTGLVSLDERMDYLDSVAPARYLWNEEGRAIWGGRTLFQAQRQIGHLIEQALAKQAGIDQPEKLPSIIQERLNKKILGS